MEVEQFLKAKVIDEVLQDKINDLHELEKIAIGDGRQVHLTLGQSPHFWQCDLSASTAREIVNNCVGICKRNIANLEKQFKDL